jgi:hypothetical protein
MRALIKLFRVAPRDAVLVVISAVLVLIVRVGLWLVPFRWVWRFCRRLGMAIRAKRRWETSQIIWATKAISCRVPGATCLTRALVAQVLLQWNDVNSNLRIGVARNQKGAFEAHAWVEYQGKILIGGLRDLFRFSVLPNF